MIPMTHSESLTHGVTKDEASSNACLSAATASSFLSIYSGRDGQVGGSNTQEKEEE
jgi:hypothetical protein